CSAVMAAYNDHIADFCAAEPRRLRGIALVNVDDPHGAVREMERCRRRGLVGAMISVLPAADRSYDLPLYEPLWSASIDLGMPLAMHVATGRAVASVDTKSEGVTRVSPSAFYLQDHFVRKSLGEMIFSGYSSGTRGCAWAPSSTRSPGSPSFSRRWTTPTRIG